MKLIKLSTEQFAKIAIVKTALIFAIALVPNLLAAQSNYYFQRKTLFETLPITSKDIVFLGNSITDGAEWAEIFDNPRIKNRGISGDRTQGVLDRLYQVTDGKPKKIFLLIGINDLTAVETSQVIDNIKKIIDRVGTETPKTKLYVQSIMPVGERLKNKMDLVPGVNKAIKEYCEQKGVTYIDLHPALADENGLLRKDYSNDQLHIMGEGYKAWADVIRPYVK